MLDTAAVRLQPAKRLTLGESVAASLREAIFQGLLKPGERIAQAQVANEMGVSQAPVRDALAVLEREGLVERSASNGAAVRALSRVDVEEICSLRAALETLGVRLAIHNATPEDLDRLQRNIRAMEEITTPGEAAALDLQFHELLMQSAKHGRLLMCWQTLQAQLKLALVQQDMVNPEFPHEVAECHQRLLDLIRGGDEKGATASIEIQLEAFRKCALKLSADGTGRNDE